MEIKIVPESIDITSDPILHLVRLERGRKVTEFYAQVTESPTVVTRERERERERERGWWWRRLKELETKKEQEGKIMQCFVFW